LTPVLDIRTYRLVPGGQADFDRILREDALPMLERFGIRVVAAGASVDDADLYYSSGPSRRLTNETTSSARSTAARSGVATIPTPSWASWRRTM
jgi:hypothetical protein